MDKQQAFWVEQLANGHQRVGISDQARDDLGAISFIDVPAVGVTLTAGGKFISVEAEKAVTDLDSPVTGQVVAINQDAIDDPSKLSSTSHDDNWIVEVN